MLTSAAALLSNAYPPLAVSLSRTSVAGSSTSATVETSSVTAQFTGGSGTVIWSWVYWDGDSSISPVSPGSATTTFRTTTATVGTISARFRATGRDYVTGEILVTGLVTATCQRGDPPLSASIGNASQTGNSSGVINITASTSCSYSGGAGTITISWPDLAGFTKSASGSSCSYTAALGPGERRAAIAIATISDANGQTLSRSFTVVCENTGTAPPTMTVTVDPAAVQGFSMEGYPVTDAVTATVSGAVGGIVEVIWTRTSGVGSPVSAGSLTTAFAYEAGVINGSWQGGYQVAVRDGLNRWAYGTAAAQFTNFIFNGPIN